MSWQVAYGLLGIFAALVWISAALTIADRRARQERER